MEGQGPPVKNRRRKYLSGAEKRARQAMGGATGGTSRTRKTATPPPGFTKAKAAEIEGDVGRAFALAGLGISRVGLLTTGYVAQANADKAAAATMKLASKSPAVYRALEKIGSVGPVTELAEIAATLVVAVQVDMGNIRPDSPLANWMGVQGAYMETHDVTAQDAAPDAAMFTAPPPTL